MLFCLCFFFLKILHVVNFVEFGKVALCLRVQNIVVFVVRLAVAEFFGYRAQLSVRGPLITGRLITGRLIIGRLLITILSNV